MDQLEQRPLSFLAACHATSKRNRRLEEIRNRGAETVLAVFRLLKNALVHSTANQSVIVSARQCAKVFGNFSAGTQLDVTLTFAGGVAFVCGELVRGSRDLFECVTELDQLLQGAGVSEVVFVSNVTHTELLAFAGALASCRRRGDVPGTLLEHNFAQIRLRSNQNALKSRDSAGDLPEIEESLRIYASALVTLRRVCDAVADGKTLPLPRVKRVAQSLVSLSGRSEIAMLALTTIANAHRDDAGRALQTAILSIAIGRQLTAEPIVLAQLAMSALLGDVGRLRLGGRLNRDRLVPLSVSAEAVVPANAAAACIAAGGVSLQNALRTALVYEANWTERESTLGPLYDRARQPLLASQILHLARAFMDRLAPRDISRPMSPAAALRALNDAPDIDADLLQLLISAIGVMPIGTVVRLDTREVGVVVGPSSDSRALDRPRVRVLTDAAKRLLAKPWEIDLGAPPANRRQVGIASVVEPGQSRFNVTAIVMGAASVG